MKWQSLSTEQQIGPGRRPLPVCMHAGTLHALALEALAHFQVVD